MLISRQDEIFSAVTPDDYTATIEVKDAWERPKYTFGLLHVLLLSSSNASINQIYVFSASQQCQIIRTDQL